MSKLNFWLVICIAKNFIWTTLKAILNFKFKDNFKFKFFFLNFLKNFLNI